MKIICGEHWNGVLAFLTELAIFELSEASGCPCFMDFISVSYGLHTGLANCVKRGEATRQREQPVRNLQRGPNVAASYVRNKDSSRQVTNGLQWGSGEVASREPTKICRSVLLMQVYSCFCSLFRGLI